MAFSHATSPPRDAPSTAADGTPCYGRRLSGEPRRLWQRASKRSFNIGFACGTEQAPSFAIESSSIRAFAEVDADVEITLYPFESRTRAR